MTSLSAIGQFRSDIALLGSISETSYENVFRMYRTEDPKNNFFFFNLLNSIYIPEDLTPDTYYVRTVERVLPWTAISYDEYQTIDLWWLIVAANNIINPILYPQPGSKLKIIKPEFVRSVLDNINEQLSQ